MVRRIALEFVYRQKGKEFELESDEIGLAMAFILAESNRKGKAKITHLTAVSFPFWIIQVSDSRSIVLSSIGDDSTKISVSESKALGPIRRILTKEIMNSEDIPDAVAKALPLVNDIEQKEHHIHNLREPEIFVRLASCYTQIEPNIELNIPEMKIDSQSSLSTSEEFQCIVEDAQNRLSNIEELQTIAHDRLTDQLRILDNVISSEISRLEKRYQVQQTNTDAKVDRLKDRLSDKTYRLRDRRRKDEKTIVTKFGRELVDIERFFSEAIEQTKILRTDLAEGEMDIQTAVERYRLLVEDLRDIQSRFDDVTNSMDDLAENSLQQAIDLDNDLDDNIRQEEVSTEEQIAEHLTALSDLNEEITQRKIEFEKLKKAVTESVTKMEKVVGVRVDDLRKELERIRYLTLENDAIKGLAPLTQLNIKTYVVTYNKGPPLIIPPIIIPEDRLSLPYEYQPLDAELDSMLQKTVKKLLKDNPAFKTSYEKVLLAGNSFQNPESMKLFKKGIDVIWTRQLLVEGVRDSLVPMFTTLVGRCPACKADIGTASKFCPECGAALA